MYKAEISELLDKKFARISKRNRNILDKIDKKIKQILTNPGRFKNLKGDMKGIKRVHIDKHFVLIFEVKETSVRFLDLDHHDKIYLNK